MATKKKKRSQAPVALVYFATLLLFMGVFGFIAFKLMQKVNDMNGDDSLAPIDDSADYTLMIARINDTSTLADVGLFRFRPGSDKIVITPVPSETIYQSEGVDLSTVYDDGGIRKLERAVEETFSINVDFYVTTAEENYESVCDVLGGIVYTPTVELYKLSEKDIDDISYRAGVAVTMNGRQIRLLVDTPDVFPAGYPDALDFCGSAQAQMVNNAFQQVNLTKSSMDNIYTLLTADGETNYTKNDYRLHKSYINEMLDHNIKPAELLVPEGTWAEDGSFTVDRTFVNELLEAYGV
ncbi:MAG: LytR family transcriptional regulator [Ruminococcus sp.]|nr:LytR family transcriptional regulator [Ruminococcus sp.]